MGFPVFRRNAFSRPAPGFKACAAAEARGLAATLSRLHPALRVHRIRRVGEIGCNSRNWRIVSRDGDFILKRADAGRLEMLELEARFNLFLGREGFPVVRFRPDARGRLVARDGAYAYSLTAFVPGRRFSGSWAEWTDLMRWTEKLAAFAGHTALPPAFRRIPARDFFEKGETDWIRRAGRAPFSLSARDIGYLLVRHEEIKAECGQKTAVRGIFHVDLHPLNLLFAKDRLRCIVDYDSYRRTGIEYAVGFSVFKCLREVVVRAGGSSALGRIMRRAGPVLARAFPSASPARLLGYGQADVMKRAVFVLKDYFETGNRQWLPMFGVQLSGLREIDRMREAVG